jgi:HPt (histidine-containing phosphotransfer) domain-containing protein
MGTTVWRQTLTDHCTTGEFVIDPAALTGLRELQGEGEPDILRELVHMFDEDARSRLTTLQEAVRQLDPLPIEQEAHALKGSCSNFGAHPMGVVCDRLERAGRTHDLVCAAALVDQLLVEYDRVRTALAAELATV